MKLGTKVESRVQLAESMRSICTLVKIFHAESGKQQNGLALAPSNVAVNQSSGRFSPPGIAAGPPSASPNSMKKARGRPPGSKWSKGCLHLINKWKHF